MDGSEAQSEGEEGSAGGEEESQSRQEPEDQVAQGARGEEAAARQGARTRSESPPGQGGGACQGERPPAGRQAWERRSQDSHQEREAGARAPRGESCRGQGQGQGRPRRPQEPQG